MLSPIQGVKPLLRCWNQKATHHHSAQLPHRGTAQYLCIAHITAHPRTPPGVDSVARHESPATGFDPRGVKQDTPQPQPFPVTPGGDEEPTESNRLLSLDVATVETSLVMGGYVAMEGSKAPRRLTV